MRLFPLRITVVLKGINQAVLIKTKEGKLKLAKIDNKGESIIYPIQNQKLPKNKKSNTILVAVGLSIFIGVLLVGGAATYFLRRDTLADRLYGRYYRKFDNGSLVMFNNTAFSEAKKRYEQDDAVAAWLIMENLPDRYSIQKELVLYKALASMDMGHYQEAVQFLDTLSVMSNSKSFMPQIKWYRGLCYLKTKDIKAAKTAFGSIAPIEPKVYRKAQKILKRLNRKHTEIR